MTMINYKRVQRNELVDLSGNPNDLLRQIAIWHHQTPRLWMPDYEASETSLQKSMKKIINTEPEILYLAIAEDELKKPLSYIWAYKQANVEDGVMILSLYTAPETRKQGVATVLKKMLEDWCRSEGINTIQTTVHYNNKKMLALNEKMGYSPGMVNMSKSL